MDEIVARTVEERRFAMVLLAGFAGIALLLGSIGIYGVLAYAVAQRRKEIGIRLALGAQVSEVTEMVFGQGWRLIWRGLAIGLAGAVSLRRLLEGQLFELSTLDASSYCWAGLILIAGGLAACVIPARRAAKVDPMVALRAE